MPALDEDLILAGTLATAQTVDISATVTLAQTAVNLGKCGLPDQAYFVVIISVGSADASVEPVVFQLQMTDDNGSTWHTVGSITVNVINNPAAFAVPVGLASFAPEGIASASIDIRAVANWETTAGTDDFDYRAFLAGPQSFPFFN